MILLAPYLKNCFCRILVARGVLLILPIKAMAGEGLNVNHGLHLLAVTGIE
jgi:hypothetical protein